jgi:hypothetical protein
MSYIALAAALTTANFLAQACTDKNFSVAAERSWFQCWAVFMASFI